MFLLQASDKTQTLLEEVSLASEDQARGVAQIGQGLTQMNSVTQSAAASAKESAAASEELSAQSEAMKHMVHRLAALVDGR